MLDAWIYDGIKDITRRAEVLESVVTATVTAGTRTVNLQSALTPSVNIYRIHRVEFQVSTTQVYPLEPRDIQEIDGLRGVNPLQSQGWPSYYYIWGVMGIDATLYLYPVGAQNGTLNIYCYRLPAALSGDGSACEVPIGWENLISLYCEYVALRRDSDPRWQDAKGIYEDELASMINLTRSHHDQAHWVTTPANLGTTWWTGGEF